MSYDYLMGGDDDFGAIGSMGDTEIVGSEYDFGSDFGSDFGGDLDFIGIGADAAPAPPPAAAQNQQQLRQQAQQMALLREVDPHAVAIKTRRLDRRRRFPIGFVTTLIGPGDQAVVPAAPQNLFRPERVVIPSDIAFDLLVQDIKVGNSSQLVSGAPIPAAVFSEVAVDTHVHFKTAEIGSQISIVIQNISDQEVLFRGAMFGTVAI